MLYCFTDNINRIHFLELFLCAQVNSIYIRHMPTYSWLDTNIITYRESAYHRNDEQSQGIITIMKLGARAHISIV